MGRNGKNVPAFTMMVNFVNANVGKVVTSNEILLGENPGRNSETSYLYRFIKLGYIKSVNEKTVMDPLAQYKVLKPFPEHYNSVMLAKETRIFNGLI